MQLPKIIFLICYFVTAGFMLVQSLNFIYLILDWAFTKPYEFVSLGLCLLILAIFMYFAHNQGFKTGNFGNAITLFVISWLLTFFVLVIGYLLFSGPAH